MRGRRGLKYLASTLCRSRSSAVSDRPRDASYHWIFC